MQARKDARPHADMLACMQPIDPFDTMRYLMCFSASLYSTMAAAKIDKRVSVRCQRAHQSYTNFAAHDPLVCSDESSGTDNKACNDFHPRSAYTCATKNRPSPFNVCGLARPDGPGALIEHMSGRGRTTKWRMPTSGINNATLVCFR
jgi:hypothetical protein